jgi:hypothetical protein
VARTNHGYKADPEEAYEVLPALLELIRRTDRAGAIPHSIRRRADRSA